MEQGQVLPDPFIPPQLLIVCNKMMLSNDQVELTQRELEIVALVADGYSAKEIAQRTQLSPRTIERVIENCRFKLQARNKSQLVTKAIAGGHLPT